MLRDKIRGFLLEDKKGFDDILGQERVKGELKSALVAGRNIIIVGEPGIGKTTLAKNVARIGAEGFVRIQGSPDLTVEDILGDIDPVKALKYGPLSPEAFEKGKIFKADGGILFFDELNRCPEKLQNALLQVLEEGKATLGSFDVDFDLDIIFIGTMNPEDASTERLSDVLLDRFDVIYMHYPETADIEERIVTSRGLDLVEVPQRLLSSMVRFVRSLREGDDLEKKPSVRASIGLYDRSQASAALVGRKQATVEDLRSVIVSVLAHRIRLKPSLKYVQSPVEYIRKRFALMESEADEGGGG